MSGPFPLLDPETGAPLRADRPWSLKSDGGVRWPVVEGIPYLRVGRDGLREQALAALDAGDERSALIALLADRDDFAGGDPPRAGAIARLVDAGSPSLREAMAALEYGPVADYFAHRWSAPTYLSGLALLQEGWVEGAVVVEVACGIGHYLRDLAARGVACLGVDVVFSKLWLARRFVVPGEVSLACGDAARGFPVGPRMDGPAIAFCHDAFYFLPEKPRVVEALRRVAGRILIGHAHNRRFDHRGVAGEPKSPAEYAELLPGATLFDDADLARALWSGEPPRSRTIAKLDRVEAVAMVAGPGPRGTIDLAYPPVAMRLRVNPLLVDDDGTLRPRWPSPRFAAEYAADAPYLEGVATASVPAPWSIAGSSAEVDRLARLRILLDLPGNW